jgi:energy-converting hydrogenase A subunit M
VIGMDDDAKLKLMQKRIIKSYAWQRDIIVPLSKEFDCTIEELEDLFFDLLDLLFVIWLYIEVDLRLCRLCVQMCILLNSCFSLL